MIAMEYRDVKSCPLCGGYSRLRPKSKTIVQQEQRLTCYVECVVCHCRGPRFLLDEFESPSVARDKAVGAWNTRIGDTNVQKEEKETGS